jgi:hypothetical protein
MTPGRVISYLRVSTAKQGVDGLGIEAQRKAVADYLSGGAWQLLAEYVEVESGKRNDRPQLAAALAHCRATGATLVVAKLDRLARNVAFISALMESGAEFVAVDMPMANRLTVHVLAAVAEHEREAISARTRAALSVVKATIATTGSWTTKRGTTITRMGNPNGARALHGKGSQAAGTAAPVAKADAHALRVLPMIEAIRGKGVTTLLGIARELNGRGVLTARGGTWDATRVRNLLARGAAGVTGAIGRGCGVA